MGKQEHHSSTNRRAVEGHAGNARRRALESVAVVLPGLRGLDDTKLEALQALADMTVMFLEGDVRRR